VTRSLKTYEVGCDSKVVEGIVPSESINSLALIYVDQNPELVEVLLKERSGCSQFILARLLDFGLELPKKYEQLESSDLYQNSAKNGCGDAIFETTLKVDIAQNIPVTKKESQQFAQMYTNLVKAAKAGSTAAANKLAYYTQPHVFLRAHRKPEIDVPLSERREEREWACRSAALGDAEGQEICARMMHDGIGGERNLVEARKLFEAACSQGHEQACYSMAREYHGSVLNDKANLKEAMDRYCRAIYFGNQWSHTELESDTFRTLRPKRDWLAQLPTAQGSPPTFDRQKMLILVDRWYEPGIGNLQELRRLNCPSDLQKITAKRSEDSNLGITDALKRKRTIVEMLGDDKGIIHLIRSENLVDIYLAGRLIEDHYVPAPAQLSALDLFERAASLGHMRSKIRLLITEALVTKMKSSKEIQAEIISLVDKVEKQDSDLMGYLLYSIYEGNKPMIGTQQDPFLIEVNRYVRKFVCEGADVGSTELMYSCADLLINGKLGDSDPSRGYEYLIKAGQLGHGLALDQLKDGECPKDDCSEKKQINIDCLYAAYRSEAWISPQSPTFGTSGMRHINLP
jgi:TPR repeat protein